MATTKQTVDKSKSSSKDKGAASAQKQWELENSVQETDQFYQFDEEKYQELRSANPWKKEFVFLYFLFTQLAIIFSKR